MKRTAAALALLAVVSDGVRAELPKFEIPRLGIFRKKKEDPPAPPAQAPAEGAKPAKLTTLDVLKGDLDEKKRVAASEGLRAVDPRTQPDVIPTLMTSLQQDPSAAVRSSVAETIGKLKPISSEAGAVLETVVVADPSDAVRKAAQQALWEYHLNGYRSASSSAIPQTAEPPLAKPKAVAPTPKPPVPVVLTSKAPTTEAVAPPTPTLAPRPITTGIGKGAIYPQTIEPPLAKPRTPVAVVKTEPKVEVKPIPAPEPKVQPSPPAVEEKKAEPVAPPPAIPIPIPMPMPTGGVPVPPPSFVPTIPPPSGN